MMNSHAANDSPRWALVTATKTIWSSAVSLADAMNDQRVENVPARARFSRNFLQFALGHAGIVFEIHEANAVAFVQVADAADEARHGANARIAFAQRPDFCADVKVFGLHANDIAHV